MDEKVHIKVDDRGPYHGTYKYKGVSLGECISRIDILIRPDEKVIAKVEVQSVVDIKADPDFLVAHPETGQLKKVKKIIFEDGSTFEK